jgi:RNA polymerase sigma factor (sigma-70 family)
MNAIDLRPRLINAMKMRYCRNDAVVEDAVDEAITKSQAVEKRCENIFPLLYSITKNLLLDRAKKLKRICRKKKILKNSMKSPKTPLQESILMEFRKSFDLAVEAIEERDRKAFEMFYVDELSHRQIAEVLGLSEANTKTIVFRTKLKLRSQLVRHSA